MSEEPEPREPPAKQGDLADFVALLRTLLDSFAPRHDGGRLVVNTPGGGRVVVSLPPHRPEAE